MTTVLERAPVTAPTRSVRIGGREIGVVLPTIHDPRIHLATVTITLFVLGIGWLGFDLSIPQILLTVLTCAAIEVAWVYRQTAVLVWPASAMQTATSVALLFRVIGTENGDYWSFQGWYLFVAVGAFSLLTKYVIRFPGWRPRVQPVEHRPGRRLPRPRQRPGRAARLLVGAVRRRRWRWRTS